MALINHWVRQRDARPMLKMPTHKFETVPLNRILLDGENPRHVAIDNEPAIIAHLYAKEQVLPLAKHIAVNGLDPSTRLLLVPHPHAPGSYFSAEGNRRLCALKLLTDPAKAPTPQARRAVEALKPGMVPLPTKLEVAVLPSRPDARSWLRLRHLGALGGVGARPWRSSDKTRFDLQGEASATPNAQALALLDYAQAAKFITEAQRGQISLSTITRYLSNPVMRDALGLVNHADLTITVDPGEFGRAAQRFLLDAIAPARGTQAVVNSRQDKTGRAAYAAKLRADGVAPTTRLAVPQLAVPPAGKAAAAAKRARRHQAGPDARSHIVPDDFRPTINDMVLKRVFDELRTIDPAAFSFAGAYLLRAFIERVAILYAQKFNLGHNGDLHTVIGRCAAHLEQQGAPAPAVKMLKVMASERHAKLSPDTLGAAVHGSLIPQAIELKRHWENIAQGYTLMLQALT